MAIRDKLAAAKGALADAKTRVLVIILAVITLLTVGVVLLKFRNSRLPSAGIGSSIGVGVPSIQSIPGMGNPTREYAKLQEQQNEELAREAAHKGTAAMPTVVRTTYIDGGVSEDLSNSSGASSVAGCGVADLQRARAAGVTAEELRCRGCSLAALKAAGYTAGELRKAGFSAADLQQAGFKANELRLAGFSAKELVATGMSAQELAAAGFSVGELKEAGLGIEALRRGGFSEEELSKAGLLKPNSPTNAERCGVDQLRAARAKGVDVAQLKQLGCSVAALRAAGFSAAELKAAGFSASELKDGGFSATDLKAAGFKAEDLRNAGFSAAALKQAGFSARDLKNAGFTAGELHSAGFAAQDLKEAGFTAQELKGAGVSARDLLAAGYAADELKKAGYTVGDLIRGGGSLDGLVAGSAAAGGDGISSGGCSVKELEALKSAGTPIEQLKQRGCSAGDLRAAGFSAEELSQAGFNAAELRAAGFSADEMSRAGLSEAELQAAGLGKKNQANSTGLCSVANLRAARAGGVTLAQLKQYGCDVAALRDAGFSAAELKAAGFSAEELRAAGFSAKDLKNAGFSAGELRKAGFSADKLREAGFDAQALKAAGFSPRELLQAGVSAAELRALGVSAKELKDAGLGVDVLAEAGYSDQELQNAGFSEESIAQAKSAIGQNSQSKAGGSNNPQVVNGLTRFANLQDSLNRLTQDQAAELNAQELQNLTRQTQAMMSMQANQLIAAWTPIPSQRYVQGVEPVKEEGSEGGDLKSRGANEVNPGNHHIYKAGQVMLAVLDVEVNSDENTPVVATIAQGALNGAKVLGNFQRVDKKVLIKFSVLSVPKLDKSVGINAVAIDPSNAKSALASSVNNHYMQKYGVLLASSFVGGLGDAFQKAGGQIQTTNVGTVASLPALSGAQKALVALGSAATQFGSAISSKANTPPTVKVAAGTSIGLLLMADLAVPKNNSSLVAVATPQEKEKS